LKQIYKHCVSGYKKDEYYESNKLLEDGVDFCKIDAEGHELEVLKV